MFALWSSLNHVPINYRVWLRKQATSTIHAILWHLIIRHLDYATHFSDWPYFFVLTYLHIMTMTLVIWKFVGLICHIIEVINLHKWWDSHVFWGSHVSSTLEHAREPWNMWELGNVWETFIINRRKLIYYNHMFWTLPTKTLQLITNII
jgi:hypothetical protein